MEAIRSNGAIDLLDGPILALEGAPESIRFAYPRADWRYQIGRVSGLLNRMMKLIAAHPERARAIVEASQEERIIV